MKIAVCGSGVDNDPSLIDKARIIGREIAKSGNILITGGCWGYPYAAVKGALSENGKVISYSPAKGETEHKEKYDSYSLEVPRACGSY